MLPLALTRCMPLGASIGVLCTTLLLTAAACSDRTGEPTLAPSTASEPRSADSARDAGSHPADIPDPGPEGGGVPTVIDSVIESTGRVVLSGVQGGCWTIETPLAPFSPVNLPDGFRADGLAVAFRGTVTLPLAGCGLYPGLRLEWIHAVGTNP